jgi:inosine-uridine nucleoside N-ribohydrolase
MRIHVQFSFLLITATALLSLVGCKTAETTSKGRETVPNIIFDTDLGSDCDDAGALALLHAFADHGEVNLLGVMFTSGRNRYGVGVCDAINTWYGRGDLPLGQYQVADVGDPTDLYSKAVATATNTYHHNIVDSAPELLGAYKALLSKQPDNSVTIVTVGHPCGVLRLLQDPTGKALVQRKVVRCVSMTYTTTQPIRDWNFGRCDAEKCAGDFLRDWPTPMYFSEAGEKILTGNRKLPLTPENNPVRESYRRWRTALVEGRPSWDLVAVLFAVRPNYFTIDAGTLRQNDKSETFWDSETRDPRHHRVTPRLSNQEIADLLEDLISQSPTKANRSR